MNTLFRLLTRGVLALLALGLMASLWVSAQVPPVSAPEPEATPSPSAATTAEVEATNAPAGTPGTGTNGVASTNSPSGTNAAPESITEKLGVNLLPTIDRRYLTFGLDRVSVLRDRKFLGIALWQYVASFIFIFLAFYVSKFLDFVTRRWLKRVAGRQENPTTQVLAEIADGPVKVIAFVLLLNIGLSVFDWPPLIQRWTATIMKIVVAFSLTYAALKMVDLAIGVWRQRKVAAGRDTSLDQQLMPIVSKTLKVLVMVVAALVTLDNVGVNITGLIASLSIGGLALGLAAQNSLENFLGSVNLLADRPVRVGDFCKYGDNIGTVEEIGLRSTRIRGIDRTVTTVPNADFSKMQLTNFGRRDRILLQATLGLRYETTPDQVRYVLAKVREMLLGHPRITPDPARIRFVGYGASSLDLAIFAYVATADFNEYLAVQEDVLLRIMDIVEAAGTGFAFPSRTIYFARDGGLNGERGQAAISTVQQWRESEQLPFPDYAPERIQQFRQTLDYPPRGSALAGGTAGKRQG